MPTKLDLDDKLIEEAKKAGNHKTKKEAVTAALNEYIQYQRRMRILELAGSIDFDPKYDYKTERKGKR
jgi:Arc/MetJ family transcription regulator